MATTLYGRGDKSDSEMSVDKERLMSKSPSHEENKLKAVKLGTREGMKDLENPAPLEMLAMDPEDKSTIPDVFANSKENKDTDKASMKVYTRRVGKEVFWDKKLQRFRTFKDLEMDPEICRELMKYIMFEEERCWEDFRINAESCWDSMELEHPATLEELGMDPQNKGIISDFLRFFRDKEFSKRTGRVWRLDSSLVYDSPRTGRSNLIDAMANYLKFDVYHLDLTSFSSLAELEYTLLSTRNRSVIAIEGLYQCAGMILNLKTDDIRLAFAVRLLLYKIDGLFLGHKNKRIFLFTTNHGDQHGDAASLRPVGKDIYIHTSLPQPIALPDGGKRTYCNHLLVSNSEKANMREAYDSTKGYLLPNFDATDNNAMKIYNRRGRDCLRSMELEQLPTFAELGKDPENTREASKSLCMTESVLSLDDSTTRISSTDFDAPDYRADLVRALVRTYQSDPTMFNSEKKDTREGLNGECLTKSVLSDDDSTKRNSLPDCTSLASFSELTIEDIDDKYDFDDVGMLPNLKDEFVDGLLSSCGDEWITVSTTNHRDPHDAALLPLVNLDTDIHTASHQPIALPNGGEIVQLESSEQKSLVDFDATNDRAYQSGVPASSEKKYMIDAYKGRWESLIQRTEKDIGEGLNEEYLTKCALILDDSTEQNSVDPRRGRGRLHSTEHEQPATFAELGTDPEIEGVVCDLLRFVREKEFYKRVGKDWKRGYLLHDPPCTDISRLMAYMAKHLEFEIYNLDVTGLSSIEELTNVLVSIRNRSLIVIKDIDHWVEMLPNLKSELMLSSLLEIIHGLLSSCGDERIIILTTNHNHMDRVDAALLHPLNIDFYVHTPSPQPIAVPDGGEIMQLDSSERKPLEDFDATNNRAYQSDVLVSNSEKQSTREASRRQCMPEAESVLGFVDSTTRISSTDFDAPNNSAHLVWAYQSGPIGFNSEKKHLGEGLNRECLTKSVLSLDDSSRQKLLPDVEATKNRGEALKRECIIKSILGLEDLQQHIGGRHDDAAKNFRDSLARKSFKVIEILPIREQRNDCVPSLSIGRLILEGWVQEEKSPDLARVLQINIVEQRVTKLPICLEGLLAESASSSRWPIGLPDGRHIVMLDPLKQSTKNIAHAVWVDQCSPTVSLPEKKMVRKTLKRKCKTMSGIFEIHQQHFGRRCEGSAKSFCAMCIGKKHGTNQVSIVKRIHKQHRIHQWPFRHKWATRKRYSAGDERSFQVSRLSMNDKLDSRLQFIHISQCAKADESGPTVSNSERGSLGEALQCDSLTNTLGLNDLRKHFGARCKDAAKGLCDSLSLKSFEVLHSLPLGEQSNSIRNLARRRTLTHKHCVRLKKSQDLQQSQLSDCSGELAAQAALGLPAGGHIPSLLEKKIVRKTLKRQSRTMSVLSLEDHQQHVGRRWEDDAKFLGEQNCSFVCIGGARAAKRICRQVAIDCKPTEKRILKQHETRRCQFKQSAIDLPDGGHILSLSKKKIVRKTLKRKCRNMSVLRSEYHQHVDSKWDDAVKSLGGAHAAKHIYRQLVIHRVSRAKRICRQHGFHRWPFQQNWATLKGYFLGDERPVDVISLSMDGKLVSRLQLIHISWLGKFSPWPPALPPGEIVGRPLALSSSQLPSTSNRAHLGGQDRSGSTTSHSQNERTRDQPEGRKRKIKNLTIEDLRPYVGLTRAGAAKKFQMSETTFKRQCRRLKIEQWPKLPPGEVLKPPDPPERNTGQIAMGNEASHLPEPIEVSRLPYHERNGSVQDYIDDLLCGQENDSMDFQSVWQEMEPNPNPNPDVFLQTEVASTHMVSGNMGIPNDHRNSLASQVETRLKGHGTGSSLSQRIQDMSFVTLKVYGLDTIKFKFPLASGINELKGEVAKRLNLEPDSFNMKYEDEEGEQILIPLSEDLRDYLSSSITPVIKLWVVSKVANLTSLCESCGGSLKR